MTKNLQCASGGKHRNAAAKARCYGCSHPELIAISDKDEETARALIEDGWRQISAKGRIVAHLSLPPLHEMVEFTSECPAWLREHIRESTHSHLTRFALRKDYPEVETKTLTPSEFRAFKKLGGQNA